MSGFDQIDRKILNLLRQNARISNVDLANAVGLSASACLRRVRLLEEQGVILGYTVVTGTVTGEPTIAVIINITLERQTEEVFDRFEAAVRKHPEIHECYLMTGGADYLLRVQADSAADFERIHKEVLSRLPGVLRIHSSFSIRNVLGPKKKR
ncbi:Lrp/AsnC family transcriptional regulator [Mangrovicoccus sp. HB161399]|uniref:Lrp/AsnC family transcriptional regulator n=1 Tax=Mangrovicoccus sp. HB161399 TaxID=2720392 RepID=UPI0015579C31|nr:Lrp/AsnC family transcriptional regulator [Mangrovicoccus sp. HB161399]